MEENMSVVFVDSACELNAAQVKKLGLDMVKFNVKLNGKNVQKSDEAYLDACKNTGSLSLAVTKNDYVKAFLPYLNNGENILYFATNQMKFNITTPFSDAVKEINENFPNRKVEVVDLGLASSIAGVLLYEVGLMSKRGDADDEIKNFVNNFKNEVRGYIVTNNAKYLSECENKDVNIKCQLNVNAVVDFESQKSVVLDYVNGRKKALNQVVTFIENNSVNLADHIIVVSYAVQEQSAEYFKDCLEKKFNNECTVLLQKMSLASVMVYGADTIVVGFHGKKH